jgi:hypothetical protein
MLTKEEFKILWTTSKCLSFDCNTCKAGIKYTPQHIKDKFKKLSGKSVSCCGMMEWFKTEQWSMEQVSNFLFEKYSIVEDI